MDSCAKAKFDLRTREVIEVVKNSVDIVENVKHSMVTAVPEMFNCDLVNITVLARFHSSKQDVGELGESHGRDLEWLIAGKIKDVKVFEFTESIEALIKLLVACIRSPKMLSICSKPLKYILMVV